MKKLKKQKQMPDSEDPEKNSQTRSLKIGIYMENCLF